MGKKQRNQAIIKRRDQGVPYSQIGREFGISRQRCQQIYGTRNEMPRYKHPKFIMFDGQKKQLMILI